MAPAPVDPMSCVKCGQPISQPTDGVVKCACGAEFLLRRGRALNPDVPVVPVDPREKELSVRAPGAFTGYMGVLRPEGIAYGMLDPIVGRVMMESGGVPYHQVSSIAAWRQLSVMQLLTFIFFTVPFGGGAAIGLIAAGISGGSVVPIPFGLGILALVGLHLHRTFILKAARIRVVAATGRMLDMTFVSKAKARARFFEVMQRRCGLEPMPMP